MTKWSQVFTTKGPTSLRADRRQRLVRETKRKRRGAERGIAMIPVDDLVSDWDQAGGDQYRDPTCYGKAPQCQKVDLAYD